MITPVGTPKDGVIDALSGGLLNYGYAFELIKLSTILSDLALVADQPLPQSPEDRRILALMDAGDQLCWQARAASAVAKEGISDLRRRRREDQSPERSTDEIDRENQARPRTAYLFDSLKRPAEVRQLREVYGDHLIVLSLGADKALRKQALEAKLRPSQTAAGPSIEQRIDALISRDLREESVPGAGPDSYEYAQNIQRAFPMADMFIDVNEDVASQVARLLDRLFGSPNYQEPTDDEFAMHLAYTARTKSPELGLKVGAAIVDEEGSVLAVGANRHPTSSGSPSYDSSSYDINDLLRDTLYRLGPEVLQESVWSELESDSSALTERLLGGSLAQAKLRDLTEFQPTVHAEMAALLDALRRGVSLRDATLHVTAYPCHNCAKHLAAMGLQVRYIEPYPKSRAEIMFPDHVEGSYQPFMGIAPVRYAALFETPADRKNPDGTRKDWGQPEKRRAQPRVDAHLDQRGISEREAAATATSATF